MNDQDAIERCRDGDADAFGHLVDRYQAEAMGHALAILGNREDAADAAQTAFVKAFKALDGFESERRFYPWFYTILRNCCYKLGAQRRASVPADEETLQFLAAPETDPAEERGTRLLDQALRGLTPEDRELITLKHLDRLKYDELAEQMGIPPGTVMSRLYYARKRLRIEMDRLEANES